MIKEMRIDQREHNERSIRIEETLNKVLEQAKKTNGRVSALESDNEALEKDFTRWKTVASTVASIAGLVWAGVTFIFK